MSSGEKNIVIIGVGTGADTLTAQAQAALAGSEVWIGAPRALDLLAGSVDGVPKPTYSCYRPEEAAAVVGREDAREFAVLVSGDVGFYSAAAGVAAALRDYPVRFVPGLSTVNVFFARLQIPWQDAAFVSAHGRETDIVSSVRRNRLTFCLTGNNIAELGAALTGAGFGGVKVWIGEKLGTDSERIVEKTAADLTEESFDSLTVALFQNEAFDDRTPIGLPDNAFSRLEQIPMTKSETRALVLSKLNLRPGFICWDVGAGTGSVAVEMALNAWRGHVYAIERREDALPLILQNCVTSHVGNVTIISGEAPAALQSLPGPDAIFIGGSGGELNEIIDLGFYKNPKVRIVVTAVTIETVSAALAAFTTIGLEPEIVQLSVARAAQAGKLHLMKAQNPVTILSAGGTQ